MKITTYSFGWRFGFTLPEVVQSWGRKIDSEIIFIFEPEFAFTTGDENGYEFSGVPMVRLEYGLSKVLLPYIEGGVGLGYFDLKNFRLGSSYLFVDQIGAGFTFPGMTKGRWSLGYRYKHQSHAGILGRTNSGLDTHFITLFYDFP